MRHTEFPTSEMFDLGQASEITPGRRVVRLEVPTIGWLTKCSASALFIGFPSAKRILFLRVCNRDELPCLAF